MKKIRVLLADDHPIVMTGFAMSLEGQGLEVVAQARTPAEALAQFQQLKPDVAVLDIRFGEQLTGLDVARRSWRTRHPPPSSFSASSTRTA